MSQNIIDVSFDLQKFEAEKQKIITGLEEVYGKSASFLQLKIAPGSTGGYTELIAKTKEFNSVKKAQMVLQEKQEKLEQQRLRTITESAKATQAQEKAEQQRLKTQATQLDLTKKQAAANEQLAKSADIPLIIKSNPDQVVSATTAVNAFDKAEAEAAISATEMGNSVNKSTTALSKQGAESRKTTQEIARETQVKKQLAAQEAQALKNSVREQLAAKGSLEQRRAALIRLSAAYDNLNVAERESAYGQRLQKTIAGVTTQVKELEYATGRAQRNVGNYSGAFSKIAKGATTAYNGLRKLAYLIPGMGIGGLVLLLVEPLTNLYKWLTRDSEALVAIKQKMQDYNEVYAEANKNAGKEITDLKLLYDASQDVKLSTEDRIKAVKKLQDTYPDTFKNFTTEQVMLGEAAKGYDALSASILKTALANAARTKIESLAAQKLDIEFQKQKIENDLARRNLNAKTYSTSTNAGGGGFAMGTGGNKVTVTREQQMAENATNAAKALADQDKKAAAIDAQIQFLTSFAGQQELEKSLLGGKEQKNKKAPSPSMQSVKEALDAQFEIYKVNKQRQLALLQAEVDDQKKSFQDRIILAENFRDGTIELANETAKHEIDSDKKKLAALTENLKKAKKAEKSNIEIEMKNVSAQILIEQNKANNARLDAEEEFKKKYGEILKDTEEQRLKAFKDAENSIKNVRQEQQSAIDAAEATELGANDKLLSDKLISQEQYNKKKSKLEKDALVLSLQSQLQEAKGLRDIERLMGNSTIEYDNKIAELTGKLQSAQSQKTDDKDLSELEKRREIVKDAQLITQTIDSLVDGAYQREIDAIQRIIDLNNQRKDLAIKAIQQSTLSAQEKAAQMIILDNSVAANNRKLQRDQTALEIKKARFDRDMAVLQVLENVASANFKLIAQGGFAGIAAGIAVGLEATAAIAMIMSKPLPTMPAYGEGTNFHPGGPAIIAEAGYKELVTIPDGKSFLATKPMLLNDLPRGSKVIPLMDPIDSINHSMNSSMIIKMAAMLEGAEKPNKDNEIIRAIQEGSRMTVRAMKKQRGTNINVVVNTQWAAYIQKNVLE